MRNASIKLYPSLLSCYFISVIFSIKFLFVRLKPRERDGVEANSKRWPQQPPFIIRHFMLHSII